MNTCFIALGSNQQQPMQQVEQALINMAALGNIKLRSSWYQSQSILPDQADYINGMVELHTTLTANALLTSLQEIENQQGRIRTKRWGPRTLDLDIILFNNESISSTELTIPHAAILDRNFVLQPLLEICPNATLPDGTLLAPIAAQLGCKGLEIIF